MPKQWGALLSVQQPSIRLVPSGQPLFGLQRALELMRWSHSDDKGDILAINVCKKCRKEFIVNYWHWHAAANDQIMNNWLRYQLLMAAVVIVHTVGRTAGCASTCRCRTACKVGDCRLRECWWWLLHMALVLRYFCSWRRLKCLQFTSYHYSYWAWSHNGTIRNQKQLCGSPYG